MILYFRLSYFHVSNNALFLHSTLVLSFYIDEVLAPSTSGQVCMDPLSPYSAFFLNAPREHVFPTLVEINM